MSKSNIVAIKQNRESEANAAFANHVQSVAFALTLSRAMIGGLELVRDYWRDPTPMPTMANPKQMSPRLYQIGHTVPVLRSLIRRGLVWHDNAEGTVNRDHQYYKLSRAGLLVCDLLVEANLMAPAVKSRKRA